MPPKGYKGITVPDSLFIDLQLLKLELNAKSLSDVVQRLYNYYRGR